MVLKRYDKDALLAAAKDHKLLPLLNTVLVVKYLVSKVSSTVEIILFTDFLPYLTSSILKIRPYLSNVCYKF